MRNLSQTLTLATLLIVVAGNSLASPEATYRCPPPSAIEMRPIPSSFNAVYIAESEGLAFLGLDRAGIKAGTLSFVGAEISEVNDYWRFACRYGSELSGLTLTTSDSPSYKHCSFIDSRQYCEAEREACVLKCPATE